MRSDSPLTPTLSPVSGGEGAFLPLPHAGEGWGEGAPGGTHLDETQPDELPTQRSITLRLALMFALAALVTFALVGAALYLVLHRELLRHQDDELATNLQNMLYSIQRVDGAERWARVQAKMDTLTPGDGSVRFWVLSDDPRFQYGRGVAEIEQMSREADGSGAIVLPAHGGAFRTVSSAIEPLRERPAVRLIVGVASAPFVHTLRAFLVAFAALSLTAVLLVMWLGHGIARVGLQPLQRLSRDAQALRPTALAQRLALDALPVELSDLAAAFNGALGRLDAAYQQQQAFNADVAHELRTPLANLIGATQVALSRQRSADEFEEVLQSNLEELEQLRSIVNDMLFLARVDQGEAATSLVRASVADEVRKTIDFFEFVLDETRIGVAIEGEVDADAALETSLFRRAVSNLLQNAIEHSPAGARLVVRIARADAAVWVTIANPGEPIAPGHLARLFDRFYRVDVSRRSSSAHHGHGLGLAIVKAVARMHGGEVSAASQGGTTTIGFSVPVAGVGAAVG